MITTEGVSVEAAQKSRQAFGTVKSRAPQSVLNTARSGQNGAGTEYPPSPTRKSDLFRQVAFSVIFALRRVILLRSDIRLKPSDIGLRPVLWRI